MNETDEKLYERSLADKDDEAFGILFERYARPVTDFIEKIIHNADDAEELMMDSFAVVLSGKNRYKGKDGASFKTWFFAIARRLAWMFLRKNTGWFALNPASYEEMSENRDIADKGETPEQLSLKDEKYRVLYRALDRIDRDQRTALYLSYFEDMGTEEIAKIMRKTVKQVYNLTSRGKTKLKMILEGEGYTWDM